MKKRYIQILYEIYVKYKKNQLNFVQNFVQKAGTATLTQPA